MRKVNGRRTPSDGKSSHCLWQGELKSNSIWNTCSTIEDKHDKGFCFLLESILSQHYQMSLDKIIFVTAMNF